MLIASDYKRVFEIILVFYTENSFTHRYLIEFIGLNLEIIFEEHYHEILELIEEIFIFIFKSLEKRFSKKIEIVRYVTHVFSIQTLIYRLQFLTEMASGRY